MHKHRSRLIVLICLLALSAMLLGNINSLAQGQEPPKKKKPVDAEILVKEPTIHDDNALGMIMDSLKVFIAIEDKEVVKGAPYSATAVTEMTQTLGDGNQIIRKTEATLYRDREGRMRREQTLWTVGKWTAAGDPPREISINDPVAGVYYDLDPSTNTARKIATKLNKLEVLTELDKAKMEKMAKAAEAMKQKEAELEKLKAGAAEKIKMKEASGEQKMPVKVAGPNQAHVEAEKKKESLGKQMLEGVMAEGVRYTLTLPAGAIGNTLPIEIVDEEWYSPELQTRIMTRHRDPRSGETVYRLTNINRNDPNPVLFEVPAGYTIKEDSKLPPKKKIQEGADRQHDDSQQHDNLRTHDKQHDRSQPHIK